MSYLWLSSWTHVFRAAREQKIEWYAVVTYEALISHHDQVVEELLEVVRSGMGRYPSRGRILLTTTTKVANEEGKTKSANNGERKTSRFITNTTAAAAAAAPHRRLELHGSKNKKQSSSNSYLIPKPSSIKLWEKCLGNAKCGQILTSLTKDVFPSLGYENHGHPLKTSPETVTVRKEYGRVLFTSEGDALNRLRQSEYDYVPSFELVSMMKRSLIH